MPEFFERGYIYIAQPPLYKIKKGKQEQYLKDNEALEKYLISSAIDELGLHVNADAPAIRGQALESLIDDYQTTQKTINRLSQRYPASLLQALLSLPVFHVEQTGDRAYVEQWANQLQQRIAEIQPSLTPKVEIETFGGVVDAETGEISKQTFWPRLTIYVHNLPQHYLLESALFQSSEYARLLKSSESWFSLLEPGAYLTADVAGLPHHRRGRGFPDEPRRERQPRRTLFRPAAGLDRNRPGYPAFHRRRRQWPLRLARAGAVTARPMRDACAARTFSTA